MITDKEAYLEAAKIMRHRKPETMGGIFDCAKVDGYDNGDAWAIVDAHYRNVQKNQDYRAAAGLTAEREMVGA